MVVGAGTAVWREYSSVSTRTDMVEETEANILLYKWAVSSLSHVILLDLTTEVDGTFLSAG